MIQVCKKTKHAKIEYNKIFTETDPQTLKEIAEQLLNITQTLDNKKQSQTVQMHKLPSYGEQPGDLGMCNTTTTGVPGEQPGDPGMCNTTTTGVPGLTAARLHYLNEKMRLVQALTSQTHLASQTCLAPCFPNSFR